MDDAMLRELMAMLTPIIRRDPPCEPPIGSGEIPDTKTSTWTEPRYVCEVQYRELTPDGLLRHASFLRLRDDKRPGDCERRESAVIPSGGEAGVEESAPPPLIP